MPISTWIRDLFGIRKDVIDTKKAKLEVEKLEEEKRARNLITPATLDDIKEFDPMYLTIRERMAGSMGAEARPKPRLADSPAVRRSHSAGRFIVVIGVLTLVVLGMIKLVRYFLR